MSVARVLETFGGITLVAALAFGLGFWVAFQVSHSGYATSQAPPAVRARRPAAHHSVAGRLRLDHSFGRLVQAGADQLGPGWDWFWSMTSSSSCPISLIQLLVWWGLFFAERALQIRQGSGSERAARADTWSSRARQSLGLILPVILMYVIRRDVLGRFFPGLGRKRAGRAARDRRAGLAGPGDLAAVSSGWPGRLARLPAGPLRRRLERVGRPRRVSVHRHPGLGHRAA